MNVEQLESVVSALSAEELARFSQWFDTFTANQAGDRPHSELPLIAQVSGDMPVWTPLCASDAATTLNAFLEEQLAPRADRR